MSRRTRNNRPSILPWLVLLVLVVAGVWLWRQQSQPAPAPTTIAAGHIRIASWNIREFSDTKENLDIPAIASIIHDSQFDVLAIEEVQKGGTGARKLCAQLGEPWRIEVSKLAGNGEYFAFLYKADRIELCGRPSFIDTPDRDSDARQRTFARQPFMATFRSGQFDFTVVAVHLSWTDVARRRREAEALARFAKDMAAHGSEKDIIVVGDFNEQKSGGNLHYFDSQGWKRLVNEPTNLPPKEKPGEIYDQILLDPGYTKEWDNKAGAVRFDETRFGGNRETAREQISDHRPVWADFSTMGPDDD